MRDVERQSRPDRKKLRLAAFNYSAPGYYFVTLCISRRRCVLGQVHEDRTVLSALGQLVSDVWSRIPQRDADIALDAFVVMPNHLQGLLQLTAHETFLAAAIGAFKSLSTDAAHTTGLLADAKLWQRGFHDHVVRDEADLERLREYIANNPLKWHLDRENPVNVPRAAARAGTSPAPTG